MYTPAQRALQTMWAMVFIGAGVGHFLFSAALSQFIPTYLPGALALVLISEVFEIAGGVGMFLPRFPANGGLGVVGPVDFVSSGQHIHGNASRRGRVSGRPPQASFWARIAILPSHGLVLAMVYSTKGALSLTMTAPRFGKPLANVPSIPPVRDHFRRVC